jgi:Uma2 family endonuclease
VTKPPRYRAFGVPEYWVVDQKARVIERYRLADLKVPVIERGTLLWQPDPMKPALELDVDAIFPSPS